MKFESKTVHSGDRKKAGSYIPVTTPIYTGTSYFYDSMEQLDRVFGREEAGPSYARYDNPTSTALEELINDLENGQGTFTTSSGMMALHIAVLAALVDRPKRVVAGNVLYGATTHMLLTIFGALDVDTEFVDMCDLAAVEEAITGQKTGAIVMETITNPLLRVAELDKIAAIAHKNNVPLIVDNTFATPMLLRPLEHGASIVIHSATKYLAGHGDALGGAIITNTDHFETLKTLVRTIGPNLGPFESYLTMRGIKTLALRMEKQCVNARKIAEWLAAHPRVERVYFPGLPGHPDEATVARLLPKDHYGAMIAFEIKGGAKPEVFAFMEKLKMVVRATSLGDVHTMALYPVMASHRDVSPKQRERVGIRDNLVRISAGIEAIEDILADLSQALAV
ncbi:MAG: PLP-dependent aspartate aminotransferase family protein [Bryobacteraceae bacterium]